MKLSIAVVFMLFTILTFMLCAVIVDCPKNTSEAAPSSKENTKDAVRYPWKRIRIGANMIIYQFEYKGEEYLIIPDASIIKLKAEPVEK